jgi:hypothetical protein
MAKKTDKTIIEPIAADFAAVAKKVAQTAAPKVNKIKALVMAAPPQTAALKQIPLDLGIQVEKSIGGIEMGVLENGLPYLTQRCPNSGDGSRRNT